MPQYAPALQLAVCSSNDLFVYLANFLNLESADQNKENDPEVLNILAPQDFSDKESEVESPKGEKTILKVLADQ